MRRVLRIGQLVNNYCVTEYMKSYMNGDVECYRVTSPDGQYKLLKLFKGDSVSNGIEYGICRATDASSKMYATAVESGIWRYNGENYHYIVREYLAGERLSDILDGGKTYNWSKVKGIGYQILSALRDIHSLSPQVIHNNLTLRSILLRNINGFRNVAILGTSHLSTEICSYDVAPFTIMDLNPLYLAPEAMEGIFTVQSDIFAVGVIMYRMLRGVEPWSIPNKRMVASRVRMARRSQGMRVLAPFDEEQREFLMRMLAFEPSRRFASVDEAIDALLNGRYRELYDENDETQKAAPVRKGKAKRVRMSPKTGASGLERVAGLEDVKRVLRRNVMFVLQNEEKAERYGLKAPNGILLYGPPGCGKTYVAEMFAEESGLNFMMIKGSDLGSIYIHGTQGKIAELFQQAAAQAPMVICLDEIDGMMPNRSTVQSELASGEVNEFLSQLNNCSQRGVLVIGTTNRPEKIDPAILRTGRMDKILYVAMPNEDVRESLFRMNIEGRYASDDIDYKAIAKLTEGYVASDIAYIVNEAALSAAIADVPISEAVLREQIAATRSSVTKADIAEYEQTHNRYASSNGCLSQQRRIGFVVDADAV